MSPGGFFIVATGVLQFPPPVAKLEGTGSKGTFHMNRRARGFTLVEVLIVIAIIGIVTGLFLSGMSHAAGSAREARTKAMIARLDAVIQTRWESYRTRRVPINPSSSNRTSNEAARLRALRDLQRLEMPNRYSDITSKINDWPNCPAIDTGSMGSNTGITLPALSRAYLRAINTKATRNPGQTLPGIPNYEGPECLYLVVTLGAIEEDASPIDQFRQLDVGDKDSDGMNEFHDAWGNPIDMIRWPVAFVSDVQPDTGPIEALGDAEIKSWCQEHHDPFDPSRIDMPGASFGPDPTMRPTTQCCGFRLSPLIYSPGPDQKYGLDKGSSISGVDPYFRPSSGFPAGTPIATDEGGPLDNIHNQQLGTLTR